MALIEYPDLEQGSDEWLAARHGIVTASVVGNLIVKQQPPPLESRCPDCKSKPMVSCMSLTRKEPTPVKTPHPGRLLAAMAQPARLVTADNDTSRGLILTLAAERITGRVDPTWVSADMQRGTDEEPFARDAYADAFGVSVVELGFMTEDRWGFTLGFSPDGLIGDDGLIEIKSRRQKTHVEIVLTGEVPERHMAQIQTGLLVSGRKWCDYVDFSNGMHLFPKRVTPDPAWFNAITDAAMAAEEAIRDIITRYDAAVANLPATERIPDLEDIQVA